MIPMSQAHDPEPVVVTATDVDNARAAAMYWSSEQTARWKELAHLQSAIAGEQKELQRIHVRMRCRFLADYYFGRKRAASIAIIAALLLSGLVSVLVGIPSAAMPAVLLLCTVSAGTCSVWYLFIPNDFVLYRRADRCAAANASLSKAAAALAATLQQMAPAVEAAHENYQRLTDRYESRQNRLAITRWESLRGTDFEQFLEELFSFRGYTVERRGRTGDHGVDLILMRDALRIAVQAKGYEGSVGNEAVQQAFTGMRITGCNRCAVVTNSNFTNHAKDAALRTDCILIDGTQIGDLIMGICDPLVGISPPPRIGSVVQGD
jgi:HJR/Mrr/RecB family endonuclease